MLDSRSLPATRQEPYPLVLDILERLELEGHVTRLGAMLVRAVLRFNERGAPCFVSNQAFAKTYGVAVKTISNQLSLLVAKGILKRTQQQRQKDGQLVFRRVLYVNTCAMKSWTFKQPSDSRRAGTIKKDLKSEILSSITPDHFSIQRSKASEEVLGGQKTKPSSEPQQPPTVRCHPSTPDLGATPKIAGKGGTSVDGLFGPTERKAAAKKPDVTAVDKERAAQLREAVRVHTKAPPETQARTDFVEMSILRRKINDEDRISAVLSWYCDHLADKWTPKALSGHWFRQKFAAIEAAMLRANGTAPSPAESPPAAEPDPDESAVVTTLTTGPIWPHGSASQLPEQARRALTNVRSFQRVMNNIARQGAETETTRVTAYAVRRLLAHMGTPQFVVESWFTRVLERVARWDQWSGKLDFFAWRFDHPDVIPELREFLDWADPTFDSDWSDLVACLRAVL